MIRKKKNYFSYYVWFKNIKNANRQKIARINGRSIISYDEYFLRDMASGYNKENKNVEFSKHAYNVIDGATGEMVAKVDNRFNVFNNRGEYSCSLHNVTRLVTFVTNTILTVIIIFLILIILLLRTTGDSVKPKDIHITEGDGIAVADEWNIFGQTEEEKVILPGRRGVYYFTIHNDNYFDVEVDLDFSQDNRYSIKMEYRLRKGDYTYLAGSGNSYVGVDEMDIDSVIIPARGFVTFALDWCWVDTGNLDELDTFAGNAGDAEYTVFIKITGEEKNDK